VGVGGEEPVDTTSEYKTRWLGRVKSRDLVQREKSQSGEKKREIVYFKNLKLTKRPTTSGGGERPSYPRVGGGGDGKMGPCPSERGGQRKLMLKNGRERTPGKNLSRG